MIKKTLFVCFLILNTIYTTAQEEKHPMATGFHYGFGEQIKNTDYAYTNHFYKIQLYYSLKKTKHFQYQILLQPEVNFATHQLLNFYFVTPDDPNFEAKRAEFTKLKDINEYVLNVGFLVRTVITKNFSFYVLGSVGPLITDTATERLSKGFAFADVLAMGLSVKVNTITFDIRPSLRHTSNANLQKPNGGINTRNIEFGLSFPL